MSSEPLPLHYYVQALERAIQAQKGGRLICERIFKDGRTELRVIHIPFAREAIARHVKPYSIGLYQRVTPSLQDVRSDTDLLDIYEDLMTLIGDENLTIKFDKIKKIVGTMVSFPCAESRLERHGLALPSDELIANLEDAFSRLVVFARHESHVSEFLIQHGVYLSDPAEPLAAVD